MMCCYHSEDNHTGLIAEVIRTFIFMNVVGLLDGHYYANRGRFRWSPYNWRDRMIAGGGRF